MRTTLWRPPRCAHCLCNATRISTPWLTWTQYLKLEKTCTSKAEFSALSHTRSSLQPAGWWGVLYTPTRSCIYMLSTMYNSMTEWYGTLSCCMKRRQAAFRPADLAFRISKTIFPVYPRCTFPYGTHSRYLQRVVSSPFFKPCKSFPVSPSFLIALTGDCHGRERTFHFVVSYLHVTVSQF